MPPGDVSQKNGTSTAISISLASLASSATVGRQSAAIDLVTYMSSAPLIDVLIGGTIELAAGAPANDKSVYVYVGGSENGTVFAGDLSGSDATYTEKVPTNLTLARVIGTPDSGGLPYTMQPFSLASLFGGVLPRKVALMVRNFSGVALESTGNALTYTPVYSAIAQS